MTIDGAIAMAIDHTVDGVRRGHRGHPRRLRPRRNFARVDARRRCPFEVRNVVVHLVQRHIIEARQVEEIPQHAQDFPRRARISERPGRGRGALRPPLAVEINAGGLRERRHRQQNIGGVIGGAAAVGGNSGDKIGALQGPRTGRAVDAVQHRVGIQQQIRAARLAQHIRRVQPRPAARGRPPRRAVRHAAGPPRGRGIARRQHRQPRPRGLRNPLRDGFDGRGLTVLLRQRAEDDHAAGSVAAGSVAGLAGPN